MKQKCNQHAQRRIIIVIRSWISCTVINCWFKGGTFSVRVWEVVAVVTFAERDMSRETLLTWYDKFADKGASKTDKGK